MCVSSEGIREGCLSDTNMLSEMSNIWRDGSYPQSAGHHFEFRHKPTAPVAVLILALIPAYPTGLMGSLEY